MHGTTGAGIGGDGAAAIGAACVGGRKRASFGDGGVATIIGIGFGA